MASKQGYGADLKNYVEKRIRIKLNGNRVLLGKLKGYDPFMNIVLEDAILLPKNNNNYESCEKSNDKDNNKNNMIISNEEQNKSLGTLMIRGNSIVMWECLDKIIK